MVREPTLYLAIQGWFNRKEGVMIASGVEMSSPFIATSIGKLDFMEAW